MNRNIAEKVKTMNGLLKNRRELYDEMLGVENNDPLNKNELTNVVLELNNLGYIFKRQHYDKLMNRMIYYDWSNRNNENICKCFLTGSTHPDHKKLIQLVLFNIKLTGHYLRVLLERHSYNVEWLDILLDRDYNFTSNDIYWIRKSYNHYPRQYLNTKIETSDGLCNGMITYLILQLFMTEKISTTLFNKVITIIKNLPNVLPLYYFNLAISTIKFYSITNKNEIETFITTLFYNAIQDVSQHEYIYNTICDKYLMYPYLCNLIIQYMYKETFVEMLCDKNILKNNLNLLIDCITQHNYIVTSDFLNKILSKTEICNIYINGDNFDTLSNYIYAKKYDLKTKKFNITFSSFGSFDNFIKITTDVYDGKINTINLFEILNCKPNNDTFNIAVNKGYTNTINTLINDYGFSVNYNTLNESVKSKNFTLISQILKYNVIPDNNTISALIQVPNNKMVFNSEKDHIHHINFLRRRADRRARRRAVRRDAKRKNKNKINKTNKNTKNKNTKNKINKNKNKNISKKSKVINIVELLISHGLKIDLNCISTLLSCNEELLNLERFGIEYDEDLYFICYINQFYPKEYMNKFTIDKNILMMRHYIDKNINKQKMINFLKLHNIRPDRYMIDYGIINRDNYSKSLMNKNNCIIPSIATMYKISLCVKREWGKFYFNCDLFRKFIEKNNITKEVMMEQYEIIF